MKTKKLITTNRVISFIFIAFFLVATADISHSIGEVQASQMNEQAWAEYGQNQGFVELMIRREVYEDDQGNQREIFIHDYRNAHKMREFENQKLIISEYEHEIRNETRDYMIFDELGHVIAKYHNNIEDYNCCIDYNQYVEITRNIDKLVVEFEQKQLE